MLQDVKCPEKPNVDEHVTDDTQKKAMEDPAHAEEDGKCKKTYLGNTCVKLPPTKRRNVALLTKQRHVAFSAKAVRENDLTQVPWHMLKC